MQEGSRWVAIDNVKDQIFSEDFPSKERALAWLLDINFAETEAKP